MSRIIVRSTVAALLLVALTACATSGGSSSYSAQKRLEPATHVVDVEKVALINRAARERGVDVHWINPPRKPAHED